MLRRSGFLCRKEEFFSLFERLGKEQSLNPVPVQVGKRNARTVIGSVQGWRVWVDGGEAERSRVEGGRDLVQGGRQALTQETARHAVVEAESTLGLRRAQRQRQHRAVPFVAR